MAELASNMPKCLDAIKLWRIVIINNLFKGKRRAYKQNIQDLFFLKKLKLLVGTEYNYIIYMYMYMYTIYMHVHVYNIHACNYTQTTATVVFFRVLPHQ